MIQTGEEVSSLNTGNETAQMRLTFEPERHIFHVRELNAALQRVLETDFRGIWVAGEISGCRVAASGHYYFSLKDEVSQIKAVLFKGTARYVRFKPQDGLAVLARGNLEVYEARGEYQLIVEGLEPQGAGALQLAFDQLKRKLAAEGLFDSARKRPLPPFPHRIGLITSPTGAVIQDMLRTLERRFRGLHIRLYPTQVQGDGAVEQICEALSYFNRLDWAEVLIVARGGGSLEDLWSFNEEALARAVAASAVPVISAVGHETDFTICDFVADVRAATPSVAAELVICTRDSILEQIGSGEKRALQAIRYRLLRCERDLHQKGTERAATVVHRSLGKLSQRLDDLDERLRQPLRTRFALLSRRLASVQSRLESNDLRVQLSRVRNRLNLLTERMQRQMDARLSRLKNCQASLDLHLRQISPLAVLSRGYAIVQHESGQAVRDAAETAAGEKLHVRLHQGRLEVAVEKVN